MILLAGHVHFWGCHIQVLLSSAKAHQDVSSFVYSAVQVTLVAMATGSPVQVKPDSLFATYMLMFVSDHQHELLVIGTTLKR